MNEDRPPPTEPPEPALLATLKHLATQAGESENLKTALRHFGLWLIELADRSSTAAAAPVAEPTPIAAPPSPPVHAAPVKPEPALTFRPMNPATAAAALQMGLATGEVSPRRHEPLDVSAAMPAPAAAELNFQLVQTRCTLKAQGCAFALKRDRHLAEGGSFDQLRAEFDALIANAKQLHDCFLWMLHRDWSISDPASLETIRQCFVNLADVAALAEEMAAGHIDQTSITLLLLAEAQSAVYVALRASTLTKPDPDQHAVFEFVRNVTRHRQIYIDRFLSEDHLADPQAAADLAVRIGEARRALATDRKAQKTRAESLKKARYHAQQLHDRGADEHEHHLKTIDHAIAAFVSAGGHLSAPELFTMADQARAAIPGALPPESSIARVLAARPAPPAEVDTDDDDFDGAAPLDERQQSAEVRCAAQLMNGRVVLMIGGEARPRHARKLEEALNLRELRWVAYRPHSSAAPVESEIANPEVSIVIMPVRWNGTESMPAIRAMCRKHHRHCVTLPGGYNPNNVAHAVLAQISDKLATQPAA